MFRTAMSLRWWPRHLLGVVAVIVLCLLGRWQWDVAQSQRGGMQNLLYAFQWWAFALIVCYGWWRLLRDEARQVPTGGNVRAAAAVSTGEAGAWEGRRPTTEELITAQLADPDDADAGLDEYNQYLAWLNTRAQRSG